MNGKTSPGMAALALTLLWVVLLGMPAQAAQSGGEPAALSELLAEARAAGDGAADIARVTLTEATSRSLLRLEGDIDFPFSVGIDLPLDATPRDLSAALTAPIAETGRYVVVFEVALAKASRRVHDLKNKVSRKVVAVNKIDNPNYRRAVKLFGAYSAKLEKVPNNAKILTLFEDSRTRMATTPQFIEQPVYGEYTYKLAELECRKVLTVNYYVVDRVAKRYIKSIFDVVENENFTLAYDVDSSDPAQGAIRADIATEQQVKDWERAAVVMALSQILDKAATAQASAQAMDDPQALLGQIATSRSEASRRAEAEAYDSRSLDDPRFDSVVAIYAPGGGMGSGVYVTSNVVMTNWHVVEGHPIVEMRLYDHRETFGQVIAKDTHLDLALVKVQTRGRPMAFLDGKTLKPGDRVDAIGHPQGHMFTITRGVVSAIRKYSARTNPSQGGGPPVLYVQTDADINPGNSGGPLFKGDHIAGINTWGQRTTSASGDGVPAPGLNFAIHYAEARQFLNQALKGE